MKIFRLEACVLRACGYHGRVMRALLMTLAAACACSLSCERHDFEGEDGTKQLHQPHGAHAVGNAHHAQGDPAPH